MLCRSFLPPPQRNRSSSSEGILAVIWEGRLSVLYRMSKLALAFLVLTGLETRPLLAQASEPPEEQQELPVAAQQDAPGPANAGPTNAQRPNLRALAGLPPKWLEQLQDMTPEEQERFLQNNQRFQALPAARQEQIRRNLEKWNSLTPEQRQAARQRERALERMSPQQRQYVRDSLLPRWQQLPPARRQVIRNRLRLLQRMTPAERSAVLADPRFMRGLSPEEQSVLRDLNALRPVSP